MLAATREVKCYKLFKSVSLIPGHLVCSSSVQFNLFHLGVFTGFAEVICLLQDGSPDIKVV